MIGACVYKPSTVLVVQPGVSTHWSNPVVTPHHNRFTALSPGPPGWAGDRRELLDFIVQVKIKINPVVTTDVIYGLVVEALNSYLGDSSLILAVTWVVEWMALASAFIDTKDLHYRSVWMHDTVYVVGWKALRKRQSADHNCTLHATPWPLCYY